MTLSIEHEAPLELCARHPALVPELISRLCGQDVPAFTSAKLAPASFNQTVAQEFRADRALVCEQDGKAVLAVLFEVQRHPDKKKHRSWPLYTAALFAEHGCLTYLLVLATNQPTAHWARQPIPGFHPASPWTPLVLGPTEIPRVATLTEAAANVPLALLSALLHSAEEDGEQVAYSALRALHQAAPNAKEAADHLWWMLGLLGGILTEERMTNIERLVMHDPNTRFIPRTEFERPPFYQGVAEGKAEGKAEGRAEGKAEGILMVLRSRGLEPSEAQRQRILVCRDPGQLDFWLNHAGTVTLLAELFE